MIEVEEGRRENAALSEHPLLDFRPATPLLRAASYRDELSSSTFESDEPLIARRSRLSRGIFAIISRNYKMLRVIVTSLDRIALAISENAHGH